MEKKFILLLMFVFAGTNLFLFAQRDDRRRAEFEEMNKKRIEFFTQTMKLNTEEAKVFWPIFNELQEKKIEINRQLRRAIFEFLGNERERGRERKTRTENEYKEIVYLVAQSKVKEAKLDEEYIAKFAKVIKFEKIFLYQQAEQQFARQMLNQNRERSTERQR